MKGEVTYAVHLVSDGLVRLLNGRSLALPPHGPPEGADDQQQSLAGDLAPQEEHQSPEQRRAHARVIVRIHIRCTAGGRCPFCVRLGCDKRPSFCTPAFSRRFRHICNPKWSLAIR